MMIPALTLFTFVTLVAWSFDLFLQWIVARDPTAEKSPPGSVHSAFHGSSN